MAGQFLVRLASVYAMGGTWDYSGIPPMLTPLQVANRYPNGDTDHRMMGTWTGASSISFNPDINGISVDGGPWINSGALPPGFNITGAAMNGQCFKFNGAEFRLRIGATLGGPGAVVLAYPPPVTMAAVLALNVGVDINNVDFSATPSRQFHYTGLGITGTYDILLMRWYLTPETDACGNEHASKLEYTADPGPGSPYVPLDPDDPTAAPTPAILSVTPNHGNVAGGTAITIKGSGFGNGAIVTIDGVNATDVVVVDQYTITCTTPAHVAGSTNVVITNADGVASS